MICKKCNSENAENSKFCSSCGNELIAVENSEPKFCGSCGNPLGGDENFCGKCGSRLDSTDAQKNSTNNAQMSMSQEEKKVKKPYIWSFLSAVITFILRVSLQERFYLDRISMRGYYFHGIDDELKPLFTIIPCIAAIIALYTIYTNKKIDETQKAKMLIINGVFILLSIMFIWLNIPEKLFDF